MNSDYSAILEIVNKDYIVATQDKELKQALQKKGITIIVLRKKKHLQLVKS